MKEGERNFHIFYQLTKGASGKEKGIIPRPICLSYDLEILGLATPDYFQFLNQSRTYDVEHMDDVAEFQEVKIAMQVCEIGPQDQQALFQIVSGILHLGNINFVERGNSAGIQDDNQLTYPAYLLGIDKEFLRQKLTSRLMMTGVGSRMSAIDVSLNVEQVLQHTICLYFIVILGYQHT